MGGEGEEQIIQFEKQGGWLLVDRPDDRSIPETSANFYKTTRRNNR